MGLFLLLIGIFWVVVGTLCIFAPSLIKKKFFSKFQNMDFKKWSVVPIIAGIIFLLSAKSSTNPILIVILGILAIAKGVYAILTAPEKIKKQIDWWLNVKPNVFKAYGVVMLILGVLVLISI